MEAQLRTFGEATSSPRLASSQTAGRKLPATAAFPSAADLAVVVVVVVVGGACEALTRSRQGKITIKSGKMAERHSMLLCRPVGVTVASLTSSSFTVGQP